MFSEPHVKDHTVDTIIMFNIKSLEKQIYEIENKFVVTSPWELKSDWK